ncbi:ribonuclease H-like domain-containing protein, partial [Vararia minispora EC-137]
LFAQKWVSPEVHMPDRRTLSGPVLTWEVKRVDERTAERVQGKLSFQQSDGWKSIVKKPLLGLMMTVEGEVTLVKTRDMSGLPKTGDKLLEIVKEDDLEVEKRFGVVKTGHCTDDGPDGKKMRRLASAIWPDRIFVLCWAHQNECIVKDIAKASPIHRQAIKEATDLVKYVNHHDIVKFTFCAETRTQFNGKTWALTLPGDTRWTSIYLCTARLFMLRDPIEVIFIRNRREWVKQIGQNDTATSVERACSLAVTDSFWVLVKGLRDVFELFAIATHIYQAPSATLCHVLTTLGTLHHAFSHEHNPSWHERGLSLYIYTVFINPWLRADIFAGGVITRITLFQIADRLCRRFYGNIEMDTKFVRAFDNYYQRQGEFADGVGGMNLALFGQAYRTANVRSLDVNLTKIWQNHLQEGSTLRDFVDGRNRFVMLAIRLLSVVPNSAACERQFSAFGRTHTKLRNQLNEQTMHKTAVLKNEIMREHTALGIA